MFAFFVERSDARQGAVIGFVVLQKTVARFIHEDLSLKTIPEDYPWQHRGNIIFPTGVSKRGLNSSKLVDRTLKMRAWVKSCDKFGNMNDEYIDKQAFFCL